MSTKRSKLFAASPSLYGPGKSGKEYVWSGLPRFGANGAKKLQTLDSAQSRLRASSSKLQKRPNVQTPKTPAGKPALIPGWLAKLTDLFKRKTCNKSAIPRFSPGPVQCELSLENVKVMRNDLSDTDFELVAKPVTPKKAAPAEAMRTAVVTAPEPRTKIWNRVTTLLGAGQS